MLTDAQIITLSEIAGESIPAIEGKVSGISEGLETALQEQIALWDANRDDVDLRLDAEDVKIETQWLLDAITKRVRVWLGFPPLANSLCSALPGSIVVSGTLGW